MEENKYVLNKLKNGSFDLIIKINQKEITDAQRKIIEENKKHLELKGFRKGMAPDSKVKEEIGAEKLKELILNFILPIIYQEAIKKFNLHPIISPKIDLLSIKDGEDWEIKLISCEGPEISLGHYKDEIKSKLSTKKIWTPSEGSEKPDEKTQNEEKEKRIEKILSWLIENIKFEVSELLTEEEVNRKLSELLEQTRKLGLTIDQYLSSTKKTVEDLRKEFSDQAERNLKMEFLLGKIADEENITVNPSEVEEAISRTKDEKEKEAMNNNKYLIAIFIRQQKALDFLTSL